MRYELTMTTTFIIDTDNMEDALLNMEFPTFPTLDDDAVEFDSNVNRWIEIEEELCEMCDANPKDGGRLCDSCRTEWKESDSDES